MKIYTGVITSDWGTRFFFATGKKRFYFTLGCGVFYVTVER